MTGGGTKRSIRVRAHTRAQTLAFSLQASSKKDILTKAKAHLEKQAKVRAWW